MALNRIVYLANPSSDNEGFRKQRGWTPKPEDEEDESPKRIHAVHQQRLRSSNVSFFVNRRQRNSERTLELPAVIDLIQMHFYAIFNFSLRKIFFQRYGLSAIEYSYFNKTVLFEIVNEANFQLLINHIAQFYEAAEGESYEGKEFNLIALIHDFKFITTQRRIEILPERGAMISLISSSEKSQRQRRRLFEYLEEINAEILYNDNSPDILEVNNLSRERLMELARNFDIIRLITSARAVRVRPGTYGELRREFGFTVTVPENLITVGIIDTGVSRLEPIRNVITDISYDHTGMGAFWDESGHGTMVAGLITLGEDFLRTVRNEYEAKAKVAVIKAIHHNNDEINIPQLLQDIKDARRNHGIRLFNMSLNIPSVKKYNENYSVFAYELDRLAYENDLLIFLSVGNISEDRLNELINIEPHASHEYPTLFYCPDAGSEIHSCQSTNIHEPADSLSNISVGALAGNLEDGNLTDITPVKEFPAYYTRKFHIDYKQPINGTELKRNQTNKHLNKPDLVFEGGDLFDYSSGMEILRNPLADGERFFGRTCGTSLATPLVASLGAELLSLYPTIRTQSVKALLLNSSTNPWGSKPFGFVGFEVDLMRKLTGFGRPSRDALLFTSDNSITFLVEESIALEEVIVVPIHIPAYFAESGNKLKFTITLCYNFLPVRDNHLNYLPLHISCGIFKSCDASFIAGSQAREYQIKSGISWSDDFFGVENRLFSNTQRLSFNLQAHDVEDLNNQVCLAIRCTGKSEIDDTNLRDLKDTLHDVSIAINITEIPEGYASNQLYAEMTAINVIRNIVEGEAEGEAELG
jgi:hypothetical protein